MARIHELLKLVCVTAFRVRLAEEVGRLTNSKEFGKLFEQHIPEYTPLYDVPLKCVRPVARKIVVLERSGALPITRVSRDKIARKMRAFSCGVPGMA